MWRLAYFMQLHPKKNKFDFVISLYQGQVLNCFVLIFVSNKINKVWKKKQNRQ